MIVLFSLVGGAVAAMLPLIPFLLMLAVVGFVLYEVGLVITGIVRRWRRPKVIPAFGYPVELMDAPTPGLHELPVCSVHPVGLYSQRRQRERDDAKEKEDIRSGDYIGCFA